MMRILLPALIAAACLPANSAPAAVISRDWKSPGDSLLTYDDVNQREWLDLTESRLRMYPPASMRIQLLLADLGPGGKFAGFSWSTSSDLRAFASSAGIDLSTNEYTINEAATRALIALVDSEPLTTLSGTVFAIGILDETDPSGPTPQARIIADLRVSPSSGFFGDAGLRLPTYIDPFQIPAISVWLYRPVPEPASWIHSVLSFGFLGGVATRKGRDQRRTGRKKVAGTIPHVGRVVLTASLAAACL